MNASPVVSGGMVLIAVCVLAVVVTAAFRVASRRALAFTLAVLGWVALCSGLALAGVLSRFDARPPPMGLMFLGVFATGIAAGLSPVGTAIAQRVPLWALVAFHAYRLPLELVMHQAARERVMPEEMSFTGYNFDILTGIAAIVIALALRRGGPVWLAKAFNLLGVLLLLGITVISFAASPLVQAFGEGSHVNTWVAYFPFVLLPAVMVSAAVAGHVVLFRATRARE